MERTVVSGAKPTASTVFSSINCFEGIIRQTGGAGLLLKSVGVIRCHCLHVYNIVQYVYIRIHKKYQASRGGSFKIEALIAYRAER